MIYVAASQPFEAVFESGQTGLAGVVEVAVVDNDGVVVLGPTTVDISENLVSGSPTGIYTWNAPAAPGTPEQYTIVWSEDGSFDPDLVTVEDLVVTAAAGESLPPIPAPVGGGVSHGPCTAWTTADDLALVCDVSVLGTDLSSLDEYASAASELLFELSGRLFPGLCQKTVRPCGNRDLCGIQMLSRGYVIGWEGSYWHNHTCECRPLDQIKLSGYPVREIIEVKIDGDVVNPDTYQLHDRRYLTRVRDPLDPDVTLMWPACQIVDLPDTEDGTFSVTYTYGQNAPLLAQLAARELACELFNADLTGECALPSGTTRVIRQGVVIERMMFAAWGLQQGIWRTGLTRVDAFLNAYNGGRLRRRPSTYSPDGLKYARPAGV